MLEPQYHGSGSEKTTPDYYKRDLWYPGLSTIGPVAKKQPSTTISLTDSTGAFLIKYLKTLYSNLIEL